MKKYLLFLGMFSFLCVACQSAPTLTSVTNSVMTTSSITSASQVNEMVLIEKSFSSQDDSIDFFTSGWMTGNSKFSENSLKLIEDEKCASGPGMVRTPTFETIRSGALTITFQPTGFNNANQRSAFINQVFSFSVDFLLKAEDEYQTVRSFNYEHTISEEDTELGYFADLKPYTNQKENAAIKTFYQQEQVFNCVRIRYISKPFYTNGNTKQGMNLEIFSLQVKKIGV